MASMYSIFRRILRETLEDGFFMDGGALSGPCGPDTRRPARSYVLACVCAHTEREFRVWGWALPPICKGQAYRPLRGR